MSKLIIRSLLFKAVVKSPIIGVYKLTQVIFVWKIPAKEHNEKDRVNKTISKLRLHPWLIAMNEWKVKVNPNHVMLTWQRV